VVQRKAAGRTPRPPPRGGRQGRSPDADHLAPEGAASLGRGPSAPGRDLRAVVASAVAEGPACPARAADPPTARGQRKAVRWSPEAPVAGPLVAAQGTVEPRTAAGPTGPRSAPGRVPLRWSSPLASATSARAAPAGSGLVRWAGPVETTPWGRPRGLARCLAGDRPPVPGAAPPPPEREEGGWRARRPLLPSPAIGGPSRPSVAPWTRVRATRTSPGTGPGGVSERWRSRQGAVAGPRSPPPVEAERPTPEREARPLPAGERRPSEPARRPKDGRPAPVPLPPLSPWQPTLARLGPSEGAEGPTRTGRPSREQEGTSWAGRGRPPPVPRRSPPPFHRGGRATPVRGTRAPDRATCRILGQERGPPTPPLNRPPRRRVSIPRGPTHAAQTPMSPGTGPGRPSAPLQFVLRSKMLHSKEG
jgi:hypothetical protein